MKLFYLVLPLLLVYCTSGGAEDNQNEDLVVLSYNVNNIFDAKVDGSEYPEYLPENGWTTALYNHRLTSTAKVISDFDADIIALQEVENSTVTADLASLLDYPYHATSTSSGAIQQGLLSRKRIVVQEEHGVALHGTRAGAMHFRNMLYVVIEQGIKDVHIIVLHWKSKRGGARESEVYRRLQAKALQLLIQQIQEKQGSQAKIVVLGDFNESPDEYRRVAKRYPTALLPIHYNIASIPAGSADNLLLAGASISINSVYTQDSLYSPWLSSSYDLPLHGSYYYKGSWEPIDGVLLSESAAISNFTVITSDVLLTAAGTPKVWRPWSPEGYSDHLPILFVLHP